MALSFGECNPSKMQGTFKPCKSPAFRVLIVDDDHHIVLALKSMLETLGLEIDAANGGPAALCCLNSSRYDVVLTDLEMPGMSGHGLARNIRAKWPNTRVVIMTGRSYDEIGDHMHTGAVDYWMLKPFNMGDLAAALNHIGESDQR